MEARRKQMMDKAMAKKRRRAVKTQGRSEQASEPGLGTKVQDLAKIAVDKIEEIAAATGRKIKNAVT